MSQHTPGPWEIVPPVDVEDDYWIADGGMTIATGVKIEANACLISAAPDMLAVLQAIVHPDNEALCYFVPSDAHAMKLRDDVLAAIAKASEPLTQV